MSIKLLTKVISPTEKQSSMYRKKGSPVKVLQK